MFTTSAGKATFGCRLPIPKESTASLVGQLRCQLNVGSSGSRSCIQYVRRERGGSTGEAPGLSVRSRCPRLTSLQRKLGVREGKNRGEPDGNPLGQIMRPLVECPGLTARQKVKVRFLIASCDPPETKLYCYATVSRHLTLDADTPIPQRVCIIFPQGAGFIGSIAHARRGSRNGRLNALFMAKVERRTLRATVYRNLEVSVPGDSAEPLLKGRANARAKV